MRDRSQWAPLLVSWMVSMVGTVSAVEPPPTPGMRWEYICPNDLNRPWEPEDLARMNALGQKGWEMVAQLGGANLDVFCFKRPYVPEPPDPSLKVCSPLCGPGTKCVRGSCVSLCVPTCKPQEMCTASLECMPRDPAARAAAQKAAEALAQLPAQPGRDEVLGAVARLKPAIAECATKEGLSGETVITVTAVSSGAVTSARLAQGAPGGADFASCVEGAVKALRFNPFRSAKVTLQLPFSLVSRHRNVCHYFCPSETASVLVAKRPIFAMISSADLVHTKGLGSPL